MGEFNYPIIQSVYTIIIIINTIENRFQWVATYEYHCRHRLSVPHWLFYPFKIVATNKIVLQQQKQLENNQNSVSSRKNAARMLIFAKHRINSTRLELRIF